MAEIAAISAYNIRMEMEDRVYKVNAHVCTVTTRGVTFQVPDNPSATLTFDTVEGSFTYSGWNSKASDRRQRSSLHPAVARISNQFAPEMVQ